MGRDSRNIRSIINVTVSRKEGGGMQNPLSGSNPLAKKKGKHGKGNSPFVKTRRRMKISQRRGW